MSPRSSRVFALALLCAPGIASAQSVFGTNGTSCGYSTLQAAVNAAPAGGTVWVQAGTRLVSSTVVVDHSITIAGSNASCQAGTIGRPIVRRTGSGRLIEVNNNAELTLEDIELEDGIVTGANDGGTILLNGGGDLTMENAEVSGGSSADDGGCIYAVNGSAIVMASGSEVRDCTATDDGGNIGLGYGATLDMHNGATLAGGTAGDRGGNLLVEGTASADIDGLVTGGSAAYGGGVALATANGGISPSLDFVTGEVDLNTATASGGGVWVQQGATGALVELGVGTTVTNNTAETSGGGIYLGDGELDVVGSAAYGIPVVADNTANGTGANDGGGGIYLISGTMTGNLFVVEDNEALFGNGGGVYAVSSTVDLTNATFFSNVGGRGGAVAMAGGSLFLDADFGSCTPSINAANEWDYCSRVDENIGTLNSADSYAGIRLDGGATASIEHTGFRRNTSIVGEAGAIGLGTGATSAEVRNCLFEDNNWFAGLSTVYVLDGDLEVFASTFYDNVTPIVWTAGTTGEMSRNVFDDNTNEVVLVGGIVGDGNLTQTSAGFPSGVNNAFGNAALDFDGHPTSSSTLVIDQASTGPSDDILGNPRFGGADFDRGAVEVQ